MESMMNAKSMGCSKKESIGASQSSWSYRSLRKLKLKRLVSLEEWMEDEDGILFPCLEEISIIDCFNLRRAPHIYPSLKSLELRGVGGMGVVSITSSLTSLISLTITNCKDLEFLSQGLLLENELLEDVGVHGCPELQKFSLPDGEPSNNSQVQGMDVLRSSMRQLKISQCAALMSFPDVRGLISLQILHIWKCPSSRFEWFDIRSCPKLKDIGGGDGGDDDVQLSFPSLKRINFWNLGSISMLVEFGKNSDLSCLDQLNVGESEGLTVIPIELFQSFKYLRHLQII